FPLELTQEILAERGINVDLDGFRDSMEKQRARARAAWMETMPSDSFSVCTTYQCSKTDFQGYNTLTTRSQILALLVGGAEKEEVSQGEQVQVVLDQTPFYAESGGQVGDQGILIGPDGEITVNDTKSAADGVFVHYGTVSRGTVHKGDFVLAEVNEKNRLAAARNHTATHLLHSALRTVLGDHVQQMGSLVTPERLRFDFSHFAPLTNEELNRVEESVNEQIINNIIVNVFEADHNDPRVQEAIALFGEKYGDTVRVVAIGEYSKELCGGTHVRRTSELGFFHIVSESGIGTGVRRIEALTGENLLHYWQDKARVLQTAAELLKSDPDGLVSRLEQLLEQLDQQDKEIEQLRNKVMVSQLDSLLAQTVSVDGVNLLSVKVDVPDMDSLRSLGDLLKDRLGSGVTILGSPLDNKVGLVCFVSKDLVKSRGLHAGKLLRDIAPIVDGGGGGKPEMAQAGGKNPAKLDAALKKGLEIVRDLLNS
ncbi:MAG TPA: alanine--tRNA ligase, partial [Peptococcaceae bacterium]|nr:alanine--tRNA ligase [Peptococcaceae bacterium]